MFFTFTDPVLEIYGQRMQKSRQFMSDKCEGHAVSPVPIHKSW
jgi:hypothetical protein